MPKLTGDDALTEGRRIREAIGKLHDRAAEHVATTEKAQATVVRNLGDLAVQNGKLVTELRSARQLVSVLGAWRDAFDVTPADDDD